MRKDILLKQILTEFDTCSATMDLLDIIDYKYLPEFLENDIIEYLEVGGTISSILKELSLSSYASDQIEKLLKSL